MTRQPAAPPIGDVIQLLASVILLSSAWPLTKIALAAGATPLWFAEGRAVLSGLTACLLLAITGRFRRPIRADMPAILAIGGLQLGTYSALAHEAAAWVPAGRTGHPGQHRHHLGRPAVRDLPSRAHTARPLAGGGAGPGRHRRPDQPVRDRLVVAKHRHRPPLPARRRIVVSIAIVVTRATKPVLSMFELLPLCFLLGSLVLAPMIWWHAPHGTLGTSPTSWWALGYIGLIAGPVGTWCIMEATAKLPTLVSSVGFLTTTAVSLILANLFLHEPVTPALLAGSALIMAGVACAAWPPRRTA